MHRALALFALLAAFAYASADARVFRGELGRGSKRFPKVPSTVVDAGVDAGTPDAGPSYLMNVTAPTDDCTAPSISGHTFTRSGSAVCTKNDGTLVTLTSNQLRSNSGGYERESSAINLALHSRDLSQAAWTKSNATCAKTATGADEVANSASTCTASAANGTITQTVTSSGARATSAYVKRRTGTGTLEVSRNGGTSYTDITACVDSGTGCTASHSGFRRVTPLTHAALTSSQTNPSLVFRIGTSGDAFDFDYVQDEVSTIATSPISTGGTSVTRAADVLAHPSVVGISLTEGCARVCFAPKWTGATPSLVNWLLPKADSTVRFVYSATSTQGASATVNSVQIGTVNATLTAGTSSCFQTRWSATANSVYVYNETAGTSGASTAFSVINALDATWYVGGRSDGSLGPPAYISSWRYHTTPTGCAP